MLRYLARRLLGYAVLLAVAVSLVYVLAATQLRPRSLYDLRIPPVDPQTTEAALRAYNLSDAVPLLDRYGTWVTGVVTRWDWGRTPTGASVTEEIGSRVWVSLQLVAPGAILGIVVGVALGVWVATRRGFADRTVTLASLVVLATPTVVIAVVLQILALRLNQVLGIQLFEVLGATGERGVGTGAALVDRLQHLILPTLTLAAGGVAAFSRIQRALVLDQLGSDHVRTARAKGLTRREAVRRHALRTALVPTATYVAFAVATLAVGATFVEIVYGFDGMGVYAVEAVTGQDVHGTVAVAAFGGACVLGGAMLADVLVAALDPRVRR